MTDVLAQTAEAGTNGGGTPEVVLFWLLSSVAILAAVAMVTLRNVVHGALMLVVSFVATAGLFLVLQSSFLAIIQIIVYAGAIMVLFLFVIMLLGVDRDDLLVERDRWSRLASWGLAVGLVAAVAFVFVGPFTGAGSVCGDAAGTATGTGSGIECVGLDAALANSDSSVYVAAEALFTRYVFSFEFVALLLVVATVGALVIGRRSEEPEVPGGIPDVDVGPREGPEDGARREIVAPHAHGTGGEV